MQTLSKSRILQGICQHDIEELAASNECAMHANASQTVEYLLRNASKFEVHILSVGYVRNYNHIRGHDVSFMMILTFE